MTATVTDIVTHKRRLGIDVLDLCKVFGWRNTGQALTYYNPSAAEIAVRLRRR